jgi:hypothetical protein
VRGLLGRTLKMMKKTCRRFGWFVALYQALWLSACAAGAPRELAQSRDAAQTSNADQADASARESRDAAEPQVSLDAAGEPNPEHSPAPGSQGCPVHVSVTTYSYGTGNHDDDDYAPNNVGAIWITTTAGNFVRTVAAWGPNYWEFATNWVKQSNGSRVDIVAGATRKNHQNAIEADWDCRDKNLQPVPLGHYRLNVEFAETEDQSRSLTGAQALEFEIGPSAQARAAAPAGSFGPITLGVAP